MGGTFSFFDDDMEDDSFDKIDDFSDISPPNEITIRKKKRISKEYDDDNEAFEKGDIRKTRSKNRDKRKKTKRKRVSFQFDKNE